MIHCYWAVSYRLLLSVWDLVSSSDAIFGSCYQGTLVSFLPCVDIFFHARVVSLFQAAKFLHGFC